MNESLKTVHDALQMAMDAGVQQARMVLEKDVENSATVIDNKVDKLLSSSGSTLFIQLYADGRYGSFSTNMLRSDELNSFIRDAAASTRMIEPDPCRRLPDKDLYFKGEAKDLKQYDPSVEELTTGERIARAMEASEEIFGKNSRLLSVETEWGDDAEYTLTADSQGFEGETLISNHTINATVSVKGKGDEKPESWWFESGISRGDAPVAGCSTKALDRALSQLDAVKIRGGKYNAVIDSSVSSKMIAPLIRALSGGYLQQDNSFLKDSLGRKIFGDNLTLLDTPHLCALSGSRWFDEEGIATRERYIIRSGVVENFFISSYFANKMNLASTTGSPSVLRFGSIEKNELSLQKLIEAAGSGILITDFNGGNCNTATGDFSYGIRGFRIENGQVTTPVREMNVTGNMLTLWNSLLGTGNDMRTSSRWNTPSLAFEKLNFSGL